TTAPVVASTSAPAPPHEIATTPAPAPVGSNEVEPFVTHAVRPLVVPWSHPDDFGRPAPSEELQELAVRMPSDVAGVNLPADVNLTLPQWDHPWRRPNHLPTERLPRDHGTRPVPDAASTLALLAGALVVMSAAARAYRTRSKRARQM